MPCEFFIIYRRGYLCEEALRQLFDARLLLADRALLLRLQPDDPAFVAACVLAFGLERLPQLRLTNRALL